MPSLAIENVTKTQIEVPFRNVPRKNMRRELPHWRYFDIFEIELECGAVGYGETMTYYTWGSLDDQDETKIQGQNAAALLWDDSLGAGIQMALLDAVGTALSVPCYELLGNKRRNRVPMSWWCIDMPAKDWLAECHLAIERGYTRAKLKGRPWFDIRAQLDLLCRELPDWFRLDIDFNETLLDADRAIPLLRELESYPNVSRFESPIPQTDYDGNQRIYREIDADLVLHYGTPAPLRALYENIVDGFVLMGGISQLRRETAIAATAETPVLLQLVGTDLTAALSMHCNAVFNTARWGAVTCHQLFSENVVTDPIAVDEGQAVVPDEPGLGVTVDPDLIKQYQVDNRHIEPLSTQFLDRMDQTEFYSRMQTESRRSPPRLIETRWSDGTRMYFSGVNDQMLRFSRQEGNMPFFERGVQTQIIPDDGSDRWKQMHERALEEPIVLPPDVDETAVGENASDHDGDGMNDHDRR